MNTLWTRRLWSLVFPLLLALTFFFGATRNARATTTTLSGTLTTHQVSCATLCTAGTITGTFEGSFEYTMATMIATANPDIFVLTGSWKITTASGTVSGTDTTLWNVATGQFSDQAVIRSGTGAYSGATGWMNLSGVFDAAAGTGESEYNGVMVT